jgi:hypothetical protein
MNKLKEIFLKTNKSFNNFAIWSFVSNVAVSSELVISTHNMVNTLSLINTDYRTLNYVSKDIIGQVGGLFFMSKIGKKIDLSPKKALIATNILQQSSLFSSLLIPQVPQYFIPITGFSSILSNASFTIFGALNAKCIQTISKDDNNICEIYAKISLINTLGSSIGLILGLAINSLIHEESIRFLFLTFFGTIRIISFNKAIKNIL